MLLVSFLIKMKVRSQQYQEQMPAGPHGCAKSKEEESKCMLPLNCPCTDGFAVPTPLWSYEIASQMLFRGYVKLGESSPGIVRQFSVWLPDKILKVTMQRQSYSYGICVASVDSGVKKRRTKNRGMERERKQRDWENETQKEETQEGKGLKQRLKGRESKSERKTEKEQKQER